MLCGASKILPLRASEADTCKYQFILPSLALRPKEVNFVSYRPVWSEFIVPEPMLIQKQGSFISENIPALPGNFGYTGDLYRISADKFIPYRKKKSAFFSLSHSTGNDLYILDLKLGRGLILAVATSSSSSSPLSLSLSLSPSNFLFLSL